MAYLDDHGVVAAQLGRQPRSVVAPVARCHLDLPVVIAVPPHLDDGTPFPTHYWLTCPLALRRIGRLEAAGGVKAAEARIEADLEFAARHAAAAVRYARDRDVLVDSTVPHPPTGGVGGTRKGVKCLHAHYADHAAGNDNPVGEDVAQAVEPLNCGQKCVTDQAGTVVRDSDWSEPPDASSSG